MKFKNHNQSKNSGFTLIEILVALAILGGLAVLVMRIFNMSIGTKKASQLNETILQFSGQIMSFLEDKRNCSRILSGIRIDPGPGDNTGLPIAASMPDGFAITTLNGTTIAQEQTFFNNNESTELWIEDIWIDANIDNPFDATKSFHMFRAELVIQLHRVPLGEERTNIPGARRFIKRFPFLVDYSIHRAFSMYLTMQTDQTFAKDFILEQCQNIKYTDPRFVGHEISKVFCHNATDTLSHPQKTCVGICRVRDLQDVRITQCL